VSDTCARGILYPYVYEVYTFTHYSKKKSAGEWASAERGPDVLPIIMHHHQHDPAWIDSG
jgi:hypothetical protein